VKSSLPVLEVIPLFTNIPFWFQNPQDSIFWKIADAAFGGRGVEEEKVEFEAYYKSGQLKF
jgi:hypothetical protein